MKKNKQKIFIVDDHPIVRQGLRQLIGLEKDLEICGEAGSANEAITLIARKEPDLVIIDISLDDDMSGIDLIKSLNRRYSKIKTVVLSMHKESVYAERAMKSGARGYISKKYAYNTIILAIRKVLQGEIYINSEVSNKIIESLYYHSSSKASKGSIHSLSDRELDVYQMIGNGQNTKKIAGHLGISINTVQTYKRHIKEKLGLKNHYDLLQKAALWKHSSKYY
jgi:DNA-binding NarL/FixJ family response regulator